MAFAAIHVPNFMVQAVLRGEAQLRDGAIALVDGTPPLLSAWWRRTKLRCAQEFNWGWRNCRRNYAEWKSACVRERKRRRRMRLCSIWDGPFLRVWKITHRTRSSSTWPGWRSLFGSDENIAQEFVQRAAELGLLVHVAVAANLEMAVHAARGFAGITLIPAGEEEKCLSSLPVRALSPSVEALETLDRWGIRTCKELAALPVLELSERLGQEGVRLHELARGASRVRSCWLNPASLWKRRWNSRMP